MNLDTPESIKSEFKKIIQDFNQLLSNQKALGIQSLELDSASEKLMQAWGKPAAPSMPFFFEGFANSAIVFVDSEGFFFKEAGGQLLKKILHAMTLTPQKVWICNTATIERILKERSAAPPKVIVTLGQQASQTLLKSKRPLEQLRGRFHSIESINVMPTYHPSLLIQQPEYKRHVWEDMKKVMSYTGMKNGS